MCKRGKGGQGVLCLLHLLHHLHRTPLVRIFPASSGSKRPKESNRDPAFGCFHGTSSCLPSPNKVIAPKQRQPVYCNIPSTSPCASSLPQHFSYAPAFQAAPNYGTA